MGFWLTEDPRIEFRGEDNPIVVRGGMFEPQRLWYQTPPEQAFVKVLVGGYGSGKTRTLSKWLIASALHNAPVWSAGVSPSFPIARRTLIPTIRELLDGKQTIRKDLKWKYNAGDHAFTIEIDGRPPATILILSGDNPLSLKGPNLGTVGIDEPFIQEYAVFEQMVARSRDPRAKLLQIAMTGTPEELNWGYELLEGELRGKFTTMHVTADTRTNKAVKPSYAKRLMDGFDSKAAEAYVQGKFVSLAKGRVFYAFSREKNVMQMQTSGVLFAGMDFNVNPMAFCVGWHSGTRAHIIDEFEIPNADTEYACAVLREKYPQLRLVYPDPTGKRRNTAAPAGMSDFKWIARAGLVPIAPIEPWGLRDSQNSVNKKLDKGELTVDPSCKRLIRYLSEYSHELMNKQESMSHLLDAFRYPITYLYPAFRGSSAVTTMSGA
jgi:hypothetical protein